MALQPLCDDFFGVVEAPAGPSSAHLNPSVRAYLDAAREYLLDLHDQGVPSRRVNEEHADLTDRLVRKLYRLAEDRYFAHFPRLNFRVALLAVGGYGRRELCLASDIDLLLLYRGKMNPYVETLAEAITTRLWDARLTVGMATRTIQQCLKLGKEDLPTLTSYLDGRFLVGDPSLYTDLDAEVRRWIRNHSTEFIRSKLEEQRARHERMGESLFLLQPNLRESVGGLRDYHMGLWTARAVRWEVRKPEHLLLHGFIDASDLEDLLAALDFLWRVRNQLHRGLRKDDRLHFEAQEALAQRFGFKETDHRLGVEQLMQSYYLHARAVERVAHRTIDHAQTLDHERNARYKQPARAIEEGFAIVNGKLQIPSAVLLQERPVRLLSAFVASQRYDVPLSARAQRLIQQHVHLVDDGFRRDAEAAELFRQILSAPQRVYRSLSLMDEVGLLGAYLPEFGELVALWQHDMYHTYTVDVHSLFLVEQLRRLRKGRFARELPLATEMMRELPSPQLLFLGCLLHDIGKGRGGGHSEKGARMVPEIGKRLGLEPHEVETVKLLVLHHLTMSAMAEQRDVHDPRQILKLARLVGTREQLRSLYLLTVADIRSVSPVAWTSWKAGLLEALYRNAAEWLEAGAADQTAPGYFLERATERVSSTQKEALERLSARGVLVEQAAGFLDSMPRNYLLNHGPAEIAAQVEAAFDFLASDPEIGVYPFPAQAGEEVFWGVVVLAHDRPGLFSIVAGVLAACGHNILGAQVYTNRNSLAVEIYQLDLMPGGAPEQEDALRRIESQLRDTLAGKQTVEGLLANRSPTHPHTLRAKAPSVRIANDESDFYTVIDVTANDRPALLYDITRTLSQFGLDVVMARVSTRANQVTDAFYVTDNGHKILERMRQQQIEESLLTAIRQGSI
ncbi:MAG: [protein-PII] uridylyltransferase [Deltaproteobacteria bacterium]|nr:[protein-PII] uridylyltransferase [Deltaproteobacteria bacterium]